MDFGIVFSKGDRIPACTATEINDGGIGGQIQACHDILGIRLEITEFPVMGIIGIGYLGIGIVDPGMFLFIELPVRDSLSMLLVCIHVGVSP